MSQEIHYLETGSQDPFYNLAFEETVLRSRRSGEYLLLWQNDNTIVIGQNQNAEGEINRAFVEAHQIHVVRRTTGGGAVYHDLGNLNYSFITDVGDAERLTMERFTRPIVEALQGLGLQNIPVRNLAAGLLVKIVVSLVLLTALFTGIFLALPDKRQRFVHVLPGAAGAACAWVIFSELYSWYVNHIARASALYGSLSVLLLMLLWLYACLSILFYGALLNHLLFDRPEPEERCACSDT